MSAEELSEEGALIALKEFVIGEDESARVEVDVDGGLHTLEPRPIYSFERDILDDLIASSVDGNVTGAAVSIKGRWIHGWLSVKGDDYINGIWHGYQYFLKYIEAETSKFDNIGTHERSPGTYNSMYRYLLMLEDLDLIDRYRREEVPQEEYDFNVPEEFRERTFIRLESGYEENEKLWDNPIEILYGGESSSQDTEPDEPDIDLEPPDSSDNSESGKDEPNIDLSPNGEDEADDLDISDIPTPQNSYDLPETNARITDFDDMENIPTFIKVFEQDAFKQAIEDASITPDGMEASDFTIDRISVVGPWGSGNATPGSSTLVLFVEIENVSSSMNPGFITGSVNRLLSEKLNSNNIYSSVFPEYNVVSAYSSAYTNQLKSFVRTNQSTQEYYSYNSGSVKEV